MAHQHLGLRCTGAVGGFDEFSVCNLDDLGARQTRKRSHRRHTHGKRRLQRTEPGHDDDGKRKQDARNGQQHIHKAHQDCFHPAALRTGNQADQRAQHQANGHGDQGAEQRLARTKHHAGEQVTPHRVGAKEVLRARRQQRHIRALVRVMCGKQAWEQRPQQRDGQHHNRDDRARRAPALGSAALETTPRVSLGAFVGVYVGVDKRSAHFAPSLAFSVGVEAVSRSRTSRTGYSRSTMRLIST